MEVQRKNALNNFKDALGQYCAINQFIELSKRCFVSEHEKEIENRESFINLATRHSITLTDYNAENMVNVYFTNNHILFEFDNTIVVSRLIEGEYFKISQMLSSDYETKVVINKKEFIDSIDRANLLITESEKKPIIINITDGSLEVNVNSSKGKSNENIDIKKEGKDLMIGFNPKFLMDALKVIDDETVDIYLVNPKAPCFIRDANQSYIYLILPVNFTA